MSLRFFICLLGAACVPFACSSNDRSDAGTQPQSDAGAEPEPQTELPLDCPLAARYDPLTSEQIEVWPDPLFVTSDAASPTGEHLTLTPERARWIEGVPEAFAPNIGDLPAVSGFARYGRTLFRFDGAFDRELPSTVQESLTSERLVLVDLDMAPPERVPYQVIRSEDETLVMVEPLRPLRPNARHLVALTADPDATESNCISPSPVAAALYRGEAPDAALEPAARAYDGVFDEAGVARNQVIVASVFRTHDDIQRVALAADTVKASSYSWSDGPACDEPTETHVRCEGKFMAQDFRSDRMVVDGAAQASWEVSVSVWIPTQGNGPFPTAIYGHGLNGGRDADGMVKRVVPFGMALIAADALEHNDHPTAADNSNPDLNSLDFLGIDLADLAIDGPALRGHFNQSNLDRLQMLELLRANPDVDGDGNADLDMSRLAYWGVSLGGMMGPGLLALDGGIDAAMLTVPGGQLINFAATNELLVAFTPILNTIVGGPTELDAYLAVLQTFVDAGDPATFAAHVLKDRVRGDLVPHLIVPVGTADQTVPPVAGRALARALAIPHVRPVAEEVDLLEVVDAPVSANLNGRTAGFFQFDRVGGAEPIIADHEMWRDVEPTAQWQHYWRTWLDGTPEIIDPYPMFDTPPLAE